MTKLASPMLVYRVQGADGRGPWRPGLSRYWSDPYANKTQADVVTAFGLEWKKEIPKGWHCGCACRSFYELLEWFTPPERHRLDAMGYKPAAMYADRIIREDKDQVLFARRLPLSEAAVVIEWHGQRLIESLKSLKEPSVA